MKKTLALVLAVAMAMSLAAVSFAATAEDKEVAMSGLDSGNGVIAYKYDADIDQMQDKGYIEWGGTAYFPIVYDTYGIASKYAQVEKMKIKTSWEMGSDLVESVSIVKKYVESYKVGTAVDTLATPGYYYFVAVKVVSKETYTDADVVGTLTFNMKADKDTTLGTNSTGGKDTIGKTDDLDVDISFNVVYEYADWTDAKNALVDSDSFYVRYDRAYALKFSADIDDDVEFTFGGTEGTSAENEGTFTVDCSGQGKVYMKLTTTANDAIVAANATANLKFLNFSNVKFNRTGEFAYEMEDGAYAYQIVDGKLVAIPGCEYDDADETFYFNTRVLGSYVFSDVELVDAPAAVEETPVVEAPVENPETGAAA